MNNKHLKNIFIAFFASSFLFLIFLFSFLFSLLPAQILGVNIQKAVHANSSGILGYSLIVAVLSSSAIFFLNIKNKFAKLFLYGLFVAYLAILVVIDSSGGWIILIVASLTGSYFKYKSKEDKGKTLAITGVYLIAVIIAVFLIFSDTKSFIHNVGSFNFIDKISSFKINTQPIGLKDSVIIATKSFKDNWLFGSGQALFIYNFSKHTNGILSASRFNYFPIKIAEFNQELKWLRVNQSYNYLLDSVANLGLLGVGSYGGLIIIFFAVVVYIMRSLKNEDEENINIIYFIFGPALAVILLQLFIVSNITILFLFWLFIALMMVGLRNIFPDSFKDVCFLKEEKKEIYKRNFFFVFEVALILFIIVVVILGIKAGRYRLAEKNYMAYLSNEAKAGENIIKATELNPYAEVYLSALANISLDKIKVELVKQEQDLGIIKEDAVRGIETVKKNTLKHPYSAEAWELQGDLYMTVLPFVKKGASSWAIKSFERALELEPNNTRFVLELGKTYFIEGTEDGVDSVKVNKAIEYLNQVVSSCDKDDLFGFDNNKMVCLDNGEAKMYLSKALEAKGDAQKAILQLEKIENGGVMDDIDENVSFELGRLYFNNNQLEKAANILEKVIAINSNYSNALYTLGAVYEKMGKKDEAIKLYQRVVELNPENEEVIEKIHSFLKR